MTLTKFITGLLWFFGTLLLLCLFSCSRYYCQPSKRSKDYATVHKLILRSDGYIHGIAKNEVAAYQAFYECKPDSVQIGSVVWVGNWQRVRTGGRLQIGIGINIKSRNKMGI